MLQNLISRLLAANIAHLGYIACIIAVLAVCARFLNRALPTVAGKAMAKPKAALLLVALGVGFFFKDKIIPVDPVAQAANARAELDSLRNEIDEMHDLGVAEEKENYRRQYSYNHRDGKHIYHRGCDECDSNYAVRKRMDAIYRQHSDWTPGMLPKPPLPEKHR